MTVIPPVDKRILKFIRQHHIFTLATVVDTQPYVATCFYVYIEENNQFIFTSDDHTRHAKEMQIQPRVAGAIALETRIIGKIQGIQFTGVARKLEKEELKIAGHAYAAKFPVARLMETTLWSIQPDFMKMTHNLLGFGKKLIWETTEPL
ncbi:MAG: pyridoxamine 5'-phosphate oxidase family protein [Lentimicrobiaceae bacterium]|nr:pyridoxamine 5'-phosphate oxidase family protein [Lentimicrobiaceae bacterium]